MKYLIYRTKDQAEHCSSQNHGLTRLQYSGLIRHQKYGHYRNDTC